MRREILSPLLLLVWLCGRGFTQVWMIDPIPLGSPLLSNNSSSQSYNISVPLLSESDYPCQGLLNTTWNATKSYEAGKVYNITLDNDLDDAGGSKKACNGSCQISLSVGGGPFRVIQSYIGECASRTNYSFVIPTFVGDGERAVLAWTWYPGFGKPSMHMNCAQVTITNPGFAGNVSGLDSLPLVWTGVASGCTVPANHTVIFPEPGDHVIWGDPSSLSATADMQCLPPSSRSNESTIQTDHRSLYYICTFIIPDTFPVTISGANKWLPSSPARTTSSTAPPYFSLQSNLQQPTTITNSTAMRLK